MLLSTLDIALRGATVALAAAAALAGAGAAWWITGQVALRLGYNRYTKAVFSEDVNEYTVGIRYSYGY